VKYGPVCHHLLIGGSEKERKDVRKGDGGEPPETRALSGRRGGREIIVMASQQRLRDHAMACN
jgi:hypothetical protein